MEERSPTYDRGIQTTSQAHLTAWQLSLPSSAPFHSWPEYGSASASARFESKSGVCTTLHSARRSRSRGSQKLLCMLPADRQILLEFLRSHARFFSYPVVPERLTMIRETSYLMTEIRVAILLWSCHLQIRSRTHCGDGERTEIEVRRDEWPTNARKRSNGRSSFEDFAHGSCTYSILGPDSPISVHENLRSANVDGTLKSKARPASTPIRHVYAMAGFQNQASECMHMGALQTFPKQADGALCSNEHRWIRISIEPSSDRRRRPPGQRA
ncbi:hypothetical protein EJ03DRAFT_133999 [Teratosphaeria nubilosa]|uniref:Uncharacterized protein n=1 Tax=Teratosphaeria nubilosa TaxID=161662 RepID=A0A6G1L6H3_9PEZI|nr:hypothetical protein EJ03DRAFT_133999 [Teratosphaeria nubilosa]